MLATTAPATTTPAANEDPLWQELRDAPIPRRRLEPMHSGAPRALLVIALLAAAAVAAFFILPRYLGVTIPPLRWVATPQGASAAVKAPIQPAVVSEAGAPAAPTAGTEAARSSSAATDTQRAPQAVAKSRDAFSDDAYARAAGEGFAALGAGRLEEARAAFERARALRPDGSEALEGLRRVNAENGARALGALRGQAEGLEAEERWEDALATYGAILKRDPAATFAQEGKARVAARMQLRDSLQALIDRPDRLANSAPARDEAAALLQSAAEQAAPGPELRAQIERLTTLLPGLDKPVHLSLVSDNLTQVAIPTVGSFGSFAQRDIELKPGHYTVIGTREGYRDVRRDITISPGEENQTVNVRCDEQI